MIEKTFSCPGIDAKGNPLVIAIQPGRIIKTASAVHPEIQRYASSLQPEKGKIFVLLNAMGAAEYYGANINNDRFDEYNTWAASDNPIIKRAYFSLRNTDGNWGYKTFEKYGYPYMHHQNTDPNKSYGEIKLAVWNDPMKRVELVVCVDREKAAAVGAHEVVDKLDRNEHPDWSMGTKVPFDRSTCCGDNEETYKRMRDALLRNPHMLPGDAIKEAHRVSPIPGISLTRNDYCEHMMKSAGQILPNGIQVSVHNDFPRFFDISSVYIGADKIAKTIQKLASASGKSKPSTSEIYRLHRSDLEKCASVSFPTKQADTEKRTPAVMKAHGGIERFKDAIRALASREESLPSRTLDQMASVSPDRSLSTSGAMGIVLKPQEFQRIILIRMGKPGLADDLDNNHGTFRPVEEVDSSIPLSLEGIMPLIKNLLMGQMEHRSLYGPCLHRRVIRIQVSPDSVSSPEEITHPLLDKISAAYNGYRQSLASFIPVAAENICYIFPDIEEQIFQYKMEDAYTTSKVAAVEGRSATFLLSMLGLLPLAYLISAHVKGREKEGKESGMIARLIAEHPNIAAMLGSTIGHGLRATRST